MSHQPRVAKIVAIATLGLVVVLLAGGLWIAPQILSTRDTSDIAACRAQILGELNDARWNAVFTLIRAEDPNTVDIDDLLDHIDRANDVYRDANIQSQQAPDLFLRNCRRRWLR